MRQYCEAGCSLFEGSADDVLGTSVYKSYKSLILLKGMWRFSGSCISLWWLWDGHPFFSQSEEHLPDNSCPVKSIKAQVIVWDGWSISFPIRINYRTAIEMPCWNAKSLSSKSGYTPRNERLEPRNHPISPNWKRKIISTKPPFFVSQLGKFCGKFASLTTLHLGWVPSFPSFIPRSMAFIRSWSTPFDGTMISGSRSKTPGGCGTTTWGEPNM